MPSVTLGHIEWDNCPDCEHYRDNPDGLPPCEIANTVDWTDQLEVCGDGAVVCHSYRERGE